MYGSFLTPGVKNLIVINVIVFLLQVITGRMDEYNSFMLSHFALNYAGIIENYQAWTVFTYMFLHGSFWHLFFNLLALFFFGCEIERTWGTRNFIKFYLMTGLGAGVFIFAYEALKGILLGAVPFNFTIGASGALFGVLLAYSLVFSERYITVLLFFVIPVTLKAKYLIVALLGITIVFSAFFVQNISHAGHIGGVVSGMLFFLFYRNHSLFSHPYKILRSWIVKPFQRHPRAIRPVSTYERTAKNKFSFKTLTKTKSSLPLDETIMDEHEIELKIDELLDIISQKGLKSLSKEEKEFLNRVSLLYRHKFPN
ncbi:rhomboid family protein [Spirochaetota bacterium]|nr:rhomboid family protein [Spirochaetota bacterium]